MKPTFHCQTDSDNLLFIRRVKVVCAAVVLAVIVQACAASTSPVGQVDVHFEAPSNFPPTVYNFDENPITSDGFVLGRSLFYDGILSRDSSISCGFCHLQATAFTHHGHDVSHGIDDRLGTRNAPAVMNLAWQPFFFWDGGVHDLDLFSIAPIQNPVEMDEQMSHVLDKLRASTRYRNLFQKAFGSEDVTTSRTMKALSQFMLMCISSNSRYDKWVRNEGGILSDSEKAGRMVFEQKCGSCHATDLFTDFSFRDNGLGPGAVPDSGRGRITLRPEDMGKFKVPSLRNVALTAPYMHDGRIRTLQGVLNHYRFLMIRTPNLDSLFIRPGQSPGIEMTDTEAAEIIAFLQSLNDDTFTHNELLAQP